MNNSKKIFARQSIALLGSALILLNGLLVSCGPNQSLPQLMKSSVMNETSDDDSESDDSGTDDGSESDDDSGSDDESPGSVSEPDPSPSSSGDEGGSAGIDVDGPTDADVSVEGKVTKIDFGFSGESTDNKGRDLSQDKDAERSVESDGSISLTEDKDEPTGSRTDAAPEGAPVLGNNEGMGSGSGPGGKGNEGDSGSGSGGTKGKETKKFPDLPAMVGDTDRINGSMDKIIRDANALFDSFGPDLNNKIGLAVTTHNTTVTAIFAGIAIVALPGFAIPAWALGAALGAVLAGALAGSMFDFNYLDKLWNGLPEPTPPELEDTKKKLENILPSMGYHQAPPNLPGFPEASRTKRKTPSSGGLRKRWKDKDGNIYEWDAQHGEVEKYGPTGKNHLGAFDPETGKQKKPPVPGRKVEP
jgi:Cytotoxic